MLNRIATGAKATAKVTTYSAAGLLLLGGCLTAYEFVDGGRDRVREKFGPLVAKYETAKDFAENRWDRTGAWLGRQCDKVEESPENLLYVLLPLLFTVLYYRSKGHKTAEAVVAALTRTSPAPVPPGELTVGDRARARATKKQLDEDRAALVKRMGQLPREVKDAELAMLKAKDETKGAAELLEQCEQAEDEATAKYARLCAEHERAGDELAAIDRTAAELNKQIQS